MKHFVEMMERRGWTLERSNRDLELDRIGGKAVMHNFQVQIMFENAQFMFVNGTPRVIPAVSPEQMLIHVFTLRQQHYKRKGHGTAAMSEIINTAIATDIREIHLEAAQLEPWGPSRYHLDLWYKRMGFQPNQLTAYTTMIWERE